MRDKIALLLFTMVFLPACSSEGKPSSGSTSAATTSAAATSAATTSAVAKTHVVLGLFIETKHAAGEPRSVADLEKLYSDKWDAPRAKGSANGVSFAVFRTGASDDDEALRASSSRSVGRATRNLAPEAILSLLSAIAPVEDADPMPENS